MTALAGRLLVAVPGLPDPNFRRTVVLLLDHSADGAFGVVVNRPLEIDVEAVLPDWHPFTAEPHLLFQGGPVGLDGALGVALLPAGPAGTPAGVDRVVGPFALVDLDARPVDLIEQVTELRVFAGHSGWAGGQLEAEIDAGDWIVVDAEAGDPFTDEPDRLWSAVLRRQGGDLALLSLAPDDPRLN